MMTGQLATRCPACSTVFRVVPDQLRVSGGWVRCGRCTEVFDATQSLVDLDTGAPRLWSDEHAPRPTPPAQAERGAHAGVAAEPPAWSPPPPAPAPAPAPTSTPAPQRWARGPGLAPLSPPEEAPTPAGPMPAQQPAAPGDAPTDAPADAPTVEPTVEPLPAPAAPAADPPPADLRTDATGTPAFVRRAERAERWQRPRVRAALAALAVLCGFALGGQIAMAYRDLAAARFPQARPALEQACALLGCRVGPARAINALAVESSGLVRVEKSSIYRLSVALSNRAGIDVALPALELALTDTQGRLIARRVLFAADLGAAQSTIGAGRELALQATLQAALPASEPVAGYTIELFYP